MGTDRENGKRNNVICNGCGYPQSGEGPTPDHCAECPPWECADCGAMDSMAEPCKCWVSLADIPFADLKGMFARDDLSLGLPITPEVL